MSVEEMKSEAISKIAKIENEIVLQKVLAVLKEAAGNAAEDNSLSKNYDAIKDQYGDVLQKLAQ